MWWWCLKWCGAGGDYGETMVNVVVAAMTVVSKMVIVVVMMVR